MILRRSSFLGLSISDRGIACAEVAVSGDKRSVRRLAVFPFSDTACLDKAASAGQALASFLRENKFSSSAAVVGVPARWLIATERELPPINEEQARAMLRLQAERLGAAESGELVCDYVGESDTAAARKVLLVAMQRQRLDQLEALLESAGITVLAVTSSSLALASAMDGQTDLPVVLLERQGAELVWRRSGETRMLRHVAVQPNGHGTPAIAPLGSELGRAVSLAPGGNGKARELLLWDGVGLDDEQLRQLSTRLGYKLTPGDAVQTLGVQPGNSSADAMQEFGPAVSLAVAGAQRKLLALDFKRSRLTPPRARRLGREANWGILLGATVVLLIAALYILVHIRQSQLDGLNAQLKAQDTERKSSQILVDRVNFSSRYYEKRPATLECLRELTLSFRDEDRIWVTGFSVKEERSPGAATAASGHSAEPVHMGQISGKSLDQKFVADLRNRLMKNTKFKDIKMSVQESGGRTKDLNFTITFTFQPTE